MVERGALTTNRELLDWVEDWTRVLAPDAVHWCDGSATEHDRLAADLIEAGTFQRLAHDRRPGS